MSRYTKRDIAKIRRAFHKTMSCAAAAKICGCNVKTVAKYRDQEGWITKQQVKELCRGGGQTTLTVDIAVKLASGWRLHIEDKNLCPIVGITHSQLRGWLQENTKVTIVRSMRRLSADGTLLKDENGRDSISRTMETVGLYDLRAREWASLEYDYMTKLAMLIEQAITDKNYMAAFKGIQWVLAKRFPKKFGNLAGVNVNVNTAIQTNVVSVDELNLPLEIRKLILKKIRQKHKNTTESNV